MSWGNRRLAPFHDRVDRVRGRSSNTANRVRRAEQVTGGVARRIRRAKLEIQTTCKATRHAPVTGNWFASGLEVPASIIAGDLHRTCFDLFCRKRPSADACERDRGDRRDIAA